MIFIGDQLSTTVSSDIVKSGQAKGCRENAFRKEVRKEGVILREKVAYAGSKGRLARRDSTHKL